MADTTTNGFVAKSQALTVSPDVGSTLAGDAAQVSTDGLRALAARISEAEIPLPPGLDTAADLDWPAQAETGLLRAYEVRRLLQANAARDWIWYAAHHELTDDEKQVIREIPEWSALRDSGFAKALVADADRLFTSPNTDWATSFAASLYPERGGAPPEGSTW